MKNLLLNKISIAASRTTQNKYITKKKKDNDVSQKKNVVVILFLTRIWVVIKALVEIYFLFSEIEFKISESKESPSFNR